jgi:hypothetical protein
MAHPVRQCSVADTARWVSAPPPSAAWWCWWCVPSESDSGMRPSLGSRGVDSCRVHGLGASPEETVHQVGISWPRFEKHFSRNTAGGVAQGEGDHDDVVEGADDR